VTDVRVLVVDNHDSFVHTLAGYLVELGARVSLVEADALEPADVASVLSSFDAVLVSPGPGDPEGAGASIAVVREAARSGIPLLGVCLGHQAIAAAFGGRVVHAPELRHGETSDVVHDGSIPFRALPSPFVATRYHSLVVDRVTLPGELRVTAESSSGVVMGLAHRAHPIWGVQFHPESILTEGGHLLLGTWLEASGLAGAEERGRTLHPIGQVSPSRP
jgi:para-aminobenzoate synthetase component II